MTEKTAAPWRTPKGWIVRDDAERILKDQGFTEVKTTGLDDIAQTLKVVECAPYPQWRDVKVDPPDEDTPVLVAVINEAENHGTGEFVKFPETVRGTIYSHPNGVTADTDCGEFCNEEILGWQPLPAPPEGQSKEQK